jgi:4a-hydroxytetrahydrobiopterin dehydratase
MSHLVDRHCRPLPQGTPALGASEVARLLAELPGWALDAGGQRIAKTYAFSDFHRTMAFVNAVAWVAHVEDHHPDLEVSYSKCRVVFWTHTVGGLSENDLVAAAHVEALGAK